MEKEVLVTVRSLQREENEWQEPVELIMAGTCYEKNGKYYVFYEEAVEGFSELTKNRICICSDYVEVVKTGLVSSRMTYEPHVPHRTPYATPYGTIELEVKTEGIDLRLSEGRVEVKLEFELDMDGAHASDGILAILVEEKRKARTV